MKFNRVFPSIFQNYLGMAQTILFYFNFAHLLGITKRKIINLFQISSKIFNFLGKLHPFPLIPFDL